MENLTPLEKQLMKALDGISRKLQEVQSDDVHSNKVLINAVLRAQKNVQKAENENWVRGQKFKNKIRKRLRKNG
jgi:hypothetical protein